MLHILSIVAVLATGVAPQSPCSPSPCGINTVCDVNGAGSAVCRYTACCLVEFFIRRILLGWKERKNKLSIFSLSDFRQINIPKSIAYFNQGEGWGHKAMNPYSGNTNSDLMKACLYLEENGSACFLLQRKLSL